MRECIYTKALSVVKGNLAVSAPTHAPGYQTKLEQQLGKRIPGAYEFVGTRRLGKSMIRFVYFQKYEKAVFPVGFSFYKAKDEWKLNGIALGDTTAEDVKAFDVTEPGK